MGELPETASISTIFTTLRPHESGEDGGLSALAVSKAAGTQTDAEMKGTPRFR
jgi:hypothetical protein